MPRGKYPRKPKEPSQRIMGPVSAPPTKREQELSRAKAVGWDEGYAEAYKDMEAKKLLDPIREVEALERLARSGGQMIEALTTSLTTAYGRRVR